MGPGWGWGRPALDLRRAEWALWWWDWQELEHMAIPGPRCLAGVCTFGAEPGGLGGSPRKGSLPQSLAVSPSWAFLLCLRLRCSPQLVRGVGQRS